MKHLPFAVLDEFGAPADDRVDDALYSAYNEGRKDEREESAATMAQLVDALTDMLAGWKYIRSFHGDLYGVGWDRAQDKAEAAICRTRREGEMSKLITAEQREKAFRAALAKLLFEHEAELEVSDDRKPYGSHSGICEITMYGKYDEGGNQLAEFAQFRL